jgi:hypothetical protein
VANHPDSTNHIIETELQSRLVKIEGLLKSDFLAFSGGIDMTAHDLIKEAIESIPDRRRKMTVLIQTGGGYIESAEQIANTLRHHYSLVDFVVTTYCMSAGTVLVMCGDGLIMDYSATLGPIDPQIQRPDTGMFVPALGYLEQFDRLVEKSRQGTLTEVETMFFLQNFDPAELYLYEQARDLSIALLEEWLVQYKFKNWKVTETQGLKVTKELKKTRAAEIARKLNKTEEWHSHGRGITADMANKALKLKIDDLEDIPETRVAILAYQNLLLEHRMKLGHRLLVMNWKDGYRGH